MKVKSKCCGAPITTPLDWPQVPKCTKCWEECDVVNKELHWLWYGGKKAWRVWGITGFAGLLYLLFNTPDPLLEFIEDIPWIGGLLWGCHNILCFALLVAWILWGIGLSSDSENLSSDEIQSGLKEEEWERITGNGGQ